MTGLTIRPLLERDLAAADRIFRLAFGTFVRLPDPRQFAGDSDWVRSRWLADPSTALAAELDGEVVGSNFVTGWGSVGFFGPLSVRPDLWDRGVARSLLDATMPLFERAGVVHAGLFTFADSMKHLAVYQRFGFWPRFQTVVFAGTPDGPASRAVHCADVAPGDRPALLAATRRLTNAIHPGLDVTREIRNVVEHDLGDVVVTGTPEAPDGLAICHCGAGSEAGSGACFVKFGAVRPGAGGQERLAALLDACAALARRRGLERVVAGVNTARRAAYRTILARGWRAELIGIAMHRHDDPAYNHAEALILDDWR
jgi:GNAT superfamily N-acetyltransferase